MFCVAHPGTLAKWLCARCRIPVCPNCARWAGCSPCCSHACAVMYRMELASTAAWVLVVRKSWRGLHGPLSRLRLMLLCWAVRRLQRRFDAYLDGKKAGARGVRPRPLWARVRVVIPAAAMLVIVAAMAVAFVPRQHSDPPTPGQVAEVAPVAAPEPEISMPPSMPPPALRARPAPGRELARRPAAPARLAAEISRGQIERQEVALTFDGGGEANATEAILDALRARGVRATMFLSGRYIRKHPGLVRRMLAEGHEVGNHTNTHPHLTSYAQDGRHETLPHVTREFLQAELRAAAEAFREVAGRPIAPFWRAPYGEHNGEIRGWAAEAGYRHVGWTRDPASRENLDSRDWVADPNSKIYLSAREIRDRILGFGESNSHGLNGGIVLMHLGTQRRRDKAHTRLPEILDGLAARGYRLATVSELLRDLPAPPAIARLAPR